MSILLENNNYKVVQLEPTIYLEDGSIFNYAVVNKQTDKTEFRGAALPQCFAVAVELDVLVSTEAHNKVAYQQQLDLDPEISRPN